MRQQVKQLQQLREKVGDPAGKLFLKNREIDAIILMSTTVWQFFVISEIVGSPNDQELLMNITEALTNLVTGTFIIEKQPPQVSYFCNFIFFYFFYFFFIFSFFSFFFLIFSSFFSFLHPNTILMMMMTIWWSKATRLLEFSRSCPQYPPPAWKCQERWNVTPFAWRKNWVF